MPEKFKRHFLKAREAEALLNEVSEKLVDLKQIFKTKVDVELIQTGFAEIFVINGKPIMAKSGKNVFPTLAFTEFLVSSPKVFIDMGAIPHVCNGANVMAPGITRFEGEFRKGDFVLVADEKHGKPIAIGETAYDANAVKNVTQGVVVRNVHFVGDKVWNFIKKFEART